MQSSSSILKLPRSPTSKQDFEKFVKQQKIDKNNNNVSTTKETESKATFGAGFFYKITEIVALTSNVVSDTYNTLTAGGATEQRPSARKRRDYKIVGDVMQINADDSDGAYDDDEMSDIEIDCNGEEINKKTGRKDEVKWAVNDDDEEPPPPYDSSWALPKTSSSTHDAETNSEEDNLKDSPIPSPKGTDSNVESDSASTSKDVQSPTASPRRRQIRVRRPRRLIRKISKPTLTEASTPKGGEKPCNDPDKLLLKVNDKLSDMIAQGLTALTSTVELTEADILMAEEKEREEKIMKEIGQSSIGRRGRKNTVYTDDYFTTMSDGNYSSPEPLNEFGGYGAYNGFVSNGYVEPNMPKGFVNGPPVSGGFGGSARFGRFGPNSNNGGFGTNYGPSFGAPNVEYSSPENYEYGYSAYNGHGNGFVPNGFVEPSIPKGFGAGPVSGGFGGPARFGRFGASNNNNNNSGFGSNYGSFASSNVGGYSSGMYNNREFIY